MGNQTGHVIPLEGLTAERKELSFRSVYLRATPRAGYSMWVHSWAESMESWRQWDFHWATRTGQQRQKDSLLVPQKAEQKMSVVG